MGDPDQRRVPRWAWSAVVVAMAMISVAILVMPTNIGAAGLLAGFGMLVLASARVVLAFRHGW